MVVALLTFTTTTDLNHSKITHNEMTTPNLTSEKAHQSLYEHRLPYGHRLPWEGRQESYDLEFTTVSRPLADSTPQTCFYRFYHKWMQRQIIQLHFLSYVGKLRYLMSKCSTKACRQSFFILYRTKDPYQVTGVFFIFLHFSKYLFGGRLTFSQRYGTLRTCSTSERWRRLTRNHFVEF